MIRPDSIAAHLSQQWPDHLQPDARLAQYTTFGIGGPAWAVVKVSAPEDLQALMTTIRKDEIPSIVLGWGSNVLAPDDGIEGVAIVFRDDASDAINVSGVDIVVPGSVALDALAGVAVAQGLSGLEELSGIPGTLAGALMGNAGAFGRSIGEVVTWLDVLDNSGVRQRLDVSQVEFTYRKSSLRSQGLLVLAAGLHLAPGDVTTLLARQAEIMALRKSKHPDVRVHPTAGSFFKNIKVAGQDRREAAGRLLDQCDAKSMRVGSAAVFDHHANIIVNTGGATAADVVELTKAMAMRVQQRFGIELEPEIRIMSPVPPFIL